MLFKALFKTFRHHLNPYSIRFFFIIYLQKTVDIPTENSVDIPTENSVHNYKRYDKVVYIKIGVKKWKISLKERIILYSLMI